MRKKKIFEPNKSSLSQDINSVILEAYVEESSINLSSNFLGHSKVQQHPSLTQSQISGIGKSSLNGSVYSCKPISRIFTPQINKNSESYDSMESGIKK